MLLMTPPDNDNSAQLCPSKPGVPMAIVGAIDGANELRHRHGQVAVLAFIACAARRFQPVICRRLIVHWMKAAS